MIDRAFLEEYGNGRLEPETRLLADELTRRGVPVQLFVKKHLERRRLPLAASTLVAGTINVVEAALKILGRPAPVADCYPLALRAFMHRRVWESTVGAVESHFLREDGRELFVKPRDRIKRFTGYVVESAHDLGKLYGVSRQLPIWCAEVVDFVSEHRAFVIDGNVVGIRCYEGNSSVVPRRDVIEQAIACWSASGRAAAAYAIDFGVLPDGVTALIEVNDGYAIGAYGLDAGLYTDLIVRRWRELAGDG